MTSVQTVLNYEQICELLPHRPPLILVDRVLELVPGEFIHAIKCISALDPYFAGHFPGMPVLPGVYIIEGLAQSSAIMCFREWQLAGVQFEHKCLLTSVDEARFRRPVVPGDVLHYHTKFEKSRGHFGWFSGIAKVGDDIVAEAKFSAQLSSPLSKKEKRQ